MFSRGFGGFGKFTLVIGNLLPNVALYQTEPHLDIQFCGAKREFTSDPNIIPPKENFVNTFLKKSDRFLSLFGLSSERKTLLDIFIVWCYNETDIETACADIQEGMP